MAPVSDQYGQLGAGVQFYAYLTVAKWVAYHFEEWSKVLACESMHQVQCLVPVLQVWPSRVP